MTIDHALRTMITAADALCVQACERDRDRAAHLTARFDDALCAFIDAGGDHETQLVQVLISAVEKGREWRRLAA